MSTCLTGAGGGCQQHNTYGRCDANRYCQSQTTKRITMRDQFGLDDFNHVKTPGLGETLLGFSAICVETVAMRTVVFRLAALTKREVAQPGDTVA
jgi:hypothetical protein